MRRLATSVAVTAIAAAVSLGLAGAATAATPDTKPGITGAQCNAGGGGIYETVPGSYICVGGQYNGDPVVGILN